MNTDLKNAQAEPVGEVNPRCGVRWYSRNIPRAGTKLYAAPQPQASAEDIALVDEVMRGWPKFYEAWQRIRADYVARGVVK